MIRTRIPPSPTGEDLHIGNLQTALINFAFARKNHGKFIVRIEDTDRQRLVEGSEAKILKTLKDYGLIYDEGPDKEGDFGPYRQSERLKIYKKYVEELIEKEAAYYCFCSKERLDEIRKQQIAKKKIPRYDKHCLTLKNTEARIKNGESYVVRLNVPENKEVIFDDLLRGKITINTNETDDQVLLKSDGYPTYHLAVVIDDHLMEISHIIRGEEWISSTPKHILLYEVFGWTPPVFIHTSLLRNPDKSKLSKRKNPVGAHWYLDQGFLPEAVLNYLALLGWSHPEQKEIFDLEEFIRVFDLKDMQVVGPVFDIVKLEWMNGEYIRKLKIESLKLKILKYIGEKYSEDTVEKTIPLIQERIKKLSDYLPLCEFFFESPKKYEIDLSDKKNILKKTCESLSSLKNWTADVLGETMQDVAKELGVKNSEYFMIMRVAITGKKISPPLNESMEILGKEECLKRLETIQTD